MKILLFLLSVIYSTGSGAQVSKVSIQASGLTCSMCSNSIYKSLKTLSFVDKIEPNIKTSTFEITFKQNSKIDFNRLKDKVEDAGYAVAKFIATINCKNVTVNTHEIVKIGSLKFQFLNVNNQSLNGETRVKIVNNGFVPTKEYKKNTFVTSIAQDVYFVMARPT